MINLLIRWALGNRGTVLGLALSLTAYGVYVAARMPVDVFPDLSAPTVTVLVEGHGLSPIEMETQVTFPIEASMNGATGVRRVRSSSAVGVSAVWIEFEWGTDIYRARQTVTERLASVTGSLPDQTDPPIMAPISSIMGEILFLSLTSDRHSPLELGTIASTSVRRRLLAVPGVSQVTPIGGDIKQYQVVLAPRLLRARDVTASQVLRALEGTNQNVAGGVLITGATETIVEGIGRVASTDDIGATVVALRDGVPVLVSDLGVVQIGAALKRGTASASRRSADGEPVTEPAVVFAVQRQPSANTLELTGRLDVALDDIQRGLPEGMLINRDLFRQAPFVQRSIANTMNALLEGAIMVVLVIVVFLASARASLITLSVLPLSLLVAVLVLDAMGGGINTMTLGGMAIAIGALVDDAIIDVENVARRMRENFARGPGERRPVLRVVYDASVEVRPSIVLATFIILLVFTPLFALDGVEGRLLKPLGVAFMVALGASLLTAVTVTPVMCAWMLPRSLASEGKQGEARLVSALKRGFAPLLGAALAHPWRLVVPAAVLFVVSVLAAASMGRNFLPEFNEGALVVGMVTLPGSSLEESDRLAGVVQRALMEHPEIVAIGRRTGRAQGDEHVQGVEASEIDLTLDMQAPARFGLPVRTRAELLAALRAEVAAVPGIQASFGQPISHRIDHHLSGTRASIAIKIFGDDLATLRELGGAIQEVLHDVPGAVDVSAEQQTLVPTLRIAFDRTAIARHGLTVSQVASALELATMGHVSGQVLEGVNAFDLLVRMDAIERATPEAVAGTWVDTPSGGKVPLSALAMIREDRSPNFISRENVQRKFVVMSNVAGRDVGSVVDDMRAAIEAEVELPSGYWVEYGGQFESAESTARRLGWLSLGIVLGIVGLLYSVFRSMRDTTLIMLNLPLALMGGVVGVALTGGAFSVASIIGLITVFGVATRNGVMLVSHIRHLQRFEGVADFGEAIRRGTMERLAPIVMTALATGFALVPLALRGDQPGNEILSPMAVVIICGMFSATVLNMAVVPTLLKRFGRPVAPHEPSPEASAEGVLR